MCMKSNEGSGDDLQKKPEKKYNLHHVERQYPEKLYWAAALLPLQKAP